MQEKEQSGLKMLKCTECGAEISINSNRCTKCGSSIPFVGQSIPDIEIKNYNNKELKNFKKLGGIYKKKFNKIILIIAISAFVGFGTYKYIKSPLSIGVDMFKLSIAEQSALVKMQQYCKEDVKRALLHPEYSKFNIIDYKACSYPKIETTRGYIVWSVNPANGFGAISGDIVKIKCNYVCADDDNGNIVPLPDGSDFLK